MAHYPFMLPDIGEGVTEAELVEWHVAPGDEVSEGQLLASVMTQKATVELEAPVAGTIIERIGEVGESLAVGSRLLTIETAGEVTAPADSASHPEPEAAPPVPSPPPGSSPTPAPRTDPVEKAPASVGKALASPAVRQRARTLGIDLATVPAEGERVTHADLDRLLTGAKGGVPAEFRPIPGGVEQPVIGMRRQIARQMQEAKRRIPHFTYVEEVDVTRLEQLRARLQPGDAGQPRLQLLPFLVTAMCRALAGHGDLNARYDDQREVLVRYPSVHMGIAVQTDRGLMVPVLRDAQQLGLAQLATAIAGLAGRAREGTLAPGETTGSTITMTSLGKLGGIAATPIVNWPEVAILAPGRIFERPCWIDGAVEPRKLMNLSLSCDHRVVDGAVAADFVQAVKQLLEAPEQLTILDNG